MIKMTSSRYSDIFFYALASLGFALIYLLIQIYPLHPDDWEYMYVYSYDTSATKKISGIGDIIDSQYKHYFEWGGRVIAHSIAHILLFFGKTASDIITSGIYIFFIYLMCLYTSNKKGGKDPLLFLFYFLMLWLLIPYFPGVILWITGAANYLYVGVIILLFFYPFYKYYRTGKNKHSKLKLYFMPFLGIIAGCTNENSGAVLLFAIVLIMILLKVEKRKIPFWFWGGLLGAIIGFGILILAPGNINRFLSSGRSIEEFDITNPDIFWKRIIFLKYHLYYSLVGIATIIYLVFLAFYLIVCRWQHKLKDNKKALILSLFFFAVAIVSFVVLIASPIIEERSLFIVNSFIIMSIGVLLCTLNIQHIVFNISQTICYIVLIGLFIYDYPRVYSTLDKVDEIWKEREQALQRQVDEGKQDIIFTSIIDIHRKYNIGHDLNFSDDSTYWTNKRYARYKNVKSVRVISDKAEK